MSGAARKTPVALTIAGSDSGGGAGIQADLKAFARCGVHGTCAITALTAQNTVGVAAVEPVSPGMILAQAQAVAEDIAVDAIKVGMLGDAATIKAVAVALDLLSDTGAGGDGEKPPVVVDPVMVSESGARLLADDALELLISEILPRATVLTPNIPEAMSMTGAGPVASQIDLAARLREMGPEIVVVTGGHSEELTDVFLADREPVPIPGERYPGADAHGSGCTHSSVLAARLAQGDTPIEAARTARRIAAESVAAGLSGIGAGPGPVNVLGI